MDLDSISLEIPFTDIDYDVVSEISMRSAYFEYSERVKKKYGTKANFHWIKNLELSTPWKIPGATDPLNVLIFSYDDFENDCFYRCIDMKIFTFDIIPFIDNKTHIDLTPTLTVQNLPPEELEFTGHITFLIKLNFHFKKTKKTSASQDQRALFEEYFYLIYLFDNKPQDSLELAIAFYEKKVRSKNLDL